MIMTLHQKIKAVCPIFGVAVGDETNKLTWRIDFKPEATPGQRVAAQAVVGAFDVAAEEQKLKDAEQAQKDKEAILFSQPNKSVTVQDLIDLGIL
jgi:hypothetical protein